DEQHVAAPVGSPNAGLYNTMLPTTGEEIAVTLAAAQVVNTADFGFAELGSVAGHLFYDQNSSGIFDSNETGLANITVTLNGVTLSSSAVSLSTTTNAAGEYTFLVPAGTYSVTFNGADPDFPSGMTLNTTATTYSATLQGGWELENLNFGRAYAGALGGTVFADSNGNGTRDGGEGGILGAVVELFDTTGTTWRSSRVVGADGAYRFDGLANGAHVIKVRVDSLTTMSGATITADPVVPLDGIASSTITAGSQNLNLNFGYLASTTPPVTPVCPTPRGETPGAQYMVTRVGKDILGGQAYAQAQCIMAMSPNGRWTAGVRFGTTTRGFVMNVPNYAYSDVPKLTSTNPYAISTDINDAGNAVGHERWTSGVKVNVLGWIRTHATNTTQRLLTPFDANPSISVMPVSITNDSLYAFGTVDPDGPGATASQGGYWALGSRQWTAILGLREVIDASADGSVLLVVSSSGQGRIVRGSVQDGWAAILASFTGRIKGGEVSANGRYVGSSEVISGVPTPFVYDTLLGVRTNLPRAAADTLGGIVGAISDTGRVLGTLYSTGSAGSVAALWESPTAAYTTILNVLRNDGHTQQDAAYLSWNIYNGGDGMSADGLTFGVYGNNPLGMEDSLLFQTLPAAGDRLCLGNAVWLDNDADGIKEVGEPGIAGVVLRLYKTGADGEIGGAGADADFEALPSITTTSTGSYLFSPLGDGKYYITATPLSTYPTTSGAPDLADNGQDDDNNGRQPGGPGSLVYSPVITLQSGTEPVTDGDTDAESDMTQDFGFNSGIAVGDVVWNDLDNDGLYEPTNGELGVEGLTIELLNATTNAVLLSTTTDDNGYYTFSTATAANYKVRVPFLPSTTPLSSSTVVTTDNGVDNDNNGSQPGAKETAVTSMSFALATGTEPGTSGSTNYERTIDFGVRVCPALTITPTSLSAVTQDSVYSQALVATGGVAPYNWNLISGVLPDGLSLNTSGIISGAPTVVDTFIFTVQATDAKGCSSTASYSLTINCPALTLNPTSLPVATRLSAYTQAISVSGGRAPYLVVLAGGSSLPVGLQMMDNAITGIPTGSTGSYSFTLNVVDGSGCVGSRAYTLSLSCPAVSITETSLPNGTVATAYTQTLTGAGGTGPYSFSVSSGSLPTGLTLNSSTGVISGTPFSSASFAFTIRVTDAASCSGTRDFGMTPVCPAVTVNPTSFINGVVGQAYSQAVSASGGAVPYSYAVSIGTLPVGLVLNATTGAITGAPTSSAAVNFTLRATDSAGCVGTRSFTVTPVCPAITVNPSTLAVGIVGSVYSQTITATGGTAPYGFAVSAGTLPAGLTLNPTTGAITGTPTTSNVAGVSITFRVTDNNGCLGTRIISMKTCPAIVVNPSSLSNGIVGTAYSQTVTATGGTSPYSFTITSGALPAWATLNANSGVISGTPNNTTAASFTVTATDANVCSGTRAYTVTPVCPALTLTPASLSNGVVGSVYSQSVTAAGGTAPYSYAVSVGALPAGLILNGTTGAITGIPTSVTAASFTIRATDNLGCQGTQAYTVTPVCPVITVNPSTLPDGTVGAAYSQTISATGGTSPYSFSLSSGTLPAGLTLNSSTGILSGTPTASTGAATSLTFRATDNFGCQGTRAVLLKICPVITINPASLPAGTVGTAYSQTLTASGGVAAYSYAVTSGTLPLGLTLNAASGVISGTPSAAISANITVTATDANNCTGTRNYTLAMSCQSITITPALLSDGTVGVAYSQPLTATGGTAPYVWDVSAGTLPAGLNLSPGGVLSGTPTTSNAAGVNVTVRALDSLGCATTKSYLIQICPVISVNPVSLAAATVGSSYSQSLTVSGGASPYVYSLATGALPAGLSLNGSTGVISGTPTSNAGASFTLNATDANGCLGSRAYTLTPVCPSITVMPTSFPAGIVGLPFSQTIVASGGTGPYTFVILSGTVPSGLGFNTSTGVLSGTPTAVGSHNLTIQATDVFGCSGSVVITAWPICPVITLSPASLASGIVGTAYAQTFSATGGTSPYTFSLASGALPSWAALNASTGAITGTPNSVTSASFTLRATAANGCVGTQSYTVTPVCPSITVNPASLVVPTVGTSYTQTFTATGGSAPYNFTVSIGTLPTGLTLNNTTGVVSGTPTSTANASFTIRAADLYGCQGTRPYSVTPVCPSISLNPTSLPGGTVGTAYAQNVSTTGGIAPITYAISGGSMPVGLTLNAATGLISGVPTSTASSVFTLRATDANGCQGTRAYSMTPVCPTISLAPASLPVGTVGTAYSQTVTASGGTAPYAHSLSAGTLPAGLALDSVSGVISGTPTASNGSGVNITLRAVDANGCAGTRALTLRVCPVIALTPISLSNGTVGSGYSEAVAASNGAAPYVYAISSGSLPSGLSLNTTSGVISGTPVSTTEANFTLRVTDSNGCQATRAYTVTPACIAITVNPPELAGATVGTAYSQTFMVTGGSAPLTFSIGGVWPAGLTLNSTTGVFSGTPTSTAVTDFTITVTDQYGCSGSRAYSLVPVCPAITITPASLPLAGVNTPYNQVLAASGGTAPYVWAQTAGTLPIGLSFDAASATLSGTPTVSNGAGVTLTFRATDTYGCQSTINTTLIVCPAITLTPASLPDATSGTAYSQTLTATGGAAPYNFTLSSGGLPFGLALSSAGTISGTPSTTDPATFVTRATDANGCSATRTYSIAAGCPVITIAPASLPAMTVGSAFFQALTASPQSGLMGQYYSGSNFTTLLLTRQDSSIDFNWGTGSPDPAIPENNFSVRWSGTVLVPTTGTYTFEATTDDGYRLWVNNSLIIDRWYDQSPTSHIGTIALTAGTAATIRVEYYENGGGAVAQLKWSGPSLALQTVTGWQTYGYSLSSGALPTGLSLSNDGVLSGTPVNTTPSTFTVRVSDGSSCFGTRTHTITPACPAMSITTTSLADAFVGSSYSQALAGTGGNAPTSWLITSGSLPAGLSMNSGGIISGTPTSASTSSLTLTLTDNYGCQVSRALTLSARSLAIGNQIWVDTNNDGLRQSTENGVPLVRVELWSPGVDGARDNGVGDDVKIGADTVTDGNGYYQFINLQPGIYYVRIPAPPAYYPSVSTTAVTLDNGINNDNNGIQPGGAGTQVVSPLITLSAGGEPGVGVDGDGTDRDSTIDFAFANSDLCYTNAIVDNASFEFQQQPNTTGTPLAMLGYNGSGTDFGSGINGYQWIGGVNGTSGLGEPIQRVQVLAGNSGSKVGWVESSKARHGNHYMLFQGTNSCISLRAAGGGNWSSVLQTGREYQVSIWAANASTAAASIILDLGANAQIFQVITGSTPGLYQYYTVQQAEMSATAPGEQQCCGFAGASTSFSAFGSADYNNWSEATGNTALPQWRQFTWRFRVAKNVTPSQIDTASFVFSGGSSSGPIAMDHLTVCEVAASSTLTLGNQIWNDVNNNGLRDTTELGAGSVQVQLYNSTNNTAGDGDDVLLATTTTTPSGAYNFTGLSDGKYVIKVTPPTALPATSGTPVTLDNGVNNDNNGNQPGGPSTAIFSPVIDLATASESTTDGDTNPDTELSV
ncbi:MAG: putative Ig domain-containing protein, partial [Prosthecobacter sp.]